jgi:SNF2 family DNA or RNA helicase
MPESSLTYKQAIGRIDRIGQEKVPMYYYLVMKDTIDDKVYKLIEQKLDFSEKILDKLVMEEE